MFISRIKQLRLEKGESQESLALKSGVSQMTISSIERGTKGISLATAVTISNALEVCIYELFEYGCPMYSTCTRDGKKVLHCYMLKE